MSHVDTSSPITHVSLCAGYGGIDLGLRRAIPALRTIAVSEIEAFACANLVAKMEAGLLDPAPIWTDLKTFPWSDFRDRVDILSGGYPCQPFSAAGKRLGAEDPRHLWPHISAGIALMRPSCCFFENVEGHISLGLPDVIEDLAGLGYRTTWGIFSASEVGAPHQRKRVFILAYDQQQGLEGLREYCPAVCWPDEMLLAGNGGCGEELVHNSSAGLQGNLAELLNAQGRQEQSGPVGGSSGLGGACDLADPNSAGGWEDRQSSQSWPTRIEQPSSDSRGSQPREIREGQAWPSRPGEQQFAWEPPRVVVDAKSQRANRRLDVCVEECGSRRSLQSEPNDTGREDAAMGQPSSQRCEQAERAVRGEQQSSRTGEERRLGVAEAVGNAKELWRAGLCQDAAANLDEQLLESANASQHGGLDNAEGIGRQESGYQQGSAPQSPSRRQTQPPLGRDADGPADWLDDAELYTTCDNRTDELRLLGNGVVPATAERAFRVLVGELIQHANP